MTEPTFLGGFYAIGMHVDPSVSNRAVAAKRWTTGGSARLSQGFRIALEYCGNTLVRVESVHAWGFALIERIRIGMHWHWPPAWSQEAPILFFEPQQILEPGLPLEVTLVMADLSTDSLPRISIHEQMPLEPQPQETSNDG